MSVWTLSCSYYCFCYHFIGSTVVVPGRFWMVCCVCSSRTRVQGQVVRRCRDRVASYRWKTTSNLCIRTLSQRCSMERTTSSYSRSVLLYYVFIVCCLVSCIIFSSNELCIVLLLATSTLLIQIDLVRSSLYIVLS